MILPYGALIAFYPSNLFEKIVSFFDGKYCHLGICIGDNQILSMTRRGLLIQSLDRDYKYRWYDIFEIDCDEVQKKELIKFLLSQMATVKYDFSGIVNFVFSFIFQNPSKFYCSEFICWGLYYIGLLPERLQLSPLQLVNQEFIKKIEV